MEFDLECSGYNVRKFLTTFSSQGSLGDFGTTVLNDITAVVDEIEQTTDSVLDGENEEGWKLFQEKIGVRSDCVPCCQTQLGCKSCSDNSIPGVQTWSSDAAFLASAYWACRHGLHSNFKSPVLLFDAAGNWQKAWSR